MEQDDEFIIQQHHHDNNHNNNHNNNNNNHNNNNNNNLAWFPTGRSIPFPHAVPYPQQVDLMDTLLRSLQQLDWQDC